MVRTIGLVVAIAGGIVILYVIVRGWRRPFDHVIVAVGTLVAFVAIEIPNGSLPVGVGGGLSFAIVMNFALRTTMPYDGKGERHPRAPLRTIALVFSELLLAAAAALFWAFESFFWGLLFLALAIVSVVANIARVLRLEGSYWPPTDSTPR